MSTETKPKNVYKETLNLPQTAFPMEAKLVANERKYPVKLARGNARKYTELGGG